MEENEETDKNKETCHKQLMDADGTLIIYNVVFMGIIRDGSIFTQVFLIIF